MRLLRRSSNGNLQLTRVDAENPPPYAILSHTWSEGQEVTYHELKAGTGTEKKGFEKFRFCGEQAAVDGLEYFWVDTCCIDKSTSDELSSAINRMFRWYQRASKCYVYMTDVSVAEGISDAPAYKITWGDAFRRSRWFTRGWTLQELIAPRSVEFFSQERTYLGSKITLEQEISMITKIPIELLRGQCPLAAFSIEERMSWAAQRTTTMTEDKVYCLLGIFGVFLPLIYGEGEAYAEQRLRDEIQKRQEGVKLVNSHNRPASQSLPFPRNKALIGRDNELRLLEQALLLSTTHQRMTVYGLGGGGKSALAIEFAYQTMERYSAYHMFWVPAINQDSFELAYKDIGIRLRIPGIAEDNADVRKLVNEALNSGSIADWVMIVDNADDPAVLSGATNDIPVSDRWADILPHGDRGAILFTTRSREVAEQLTPGNSMKLEEISKADSEHLLAQRTTGMSLVRDKEVVRQLLELLSYLPLAIVQAAAFMNRNDLEVSEYLSLFQQATTEMELFSEEFQDANRYRELDSTIAKTWHISFNRIRRENLLAAEYLSFIACFDRTNIPESIFDREGISPVQRIKALGTLTGYAFLTKRQLTVEHNGKERFFEMHRLVHLASIRWLEGNDRQVPWANAAARLLETLVPRGGLEGRETWTKYLPHLIHLSKLNGVVSETNRDTLLDRLGKCQQYLGQYSAAEVTCRQVLSLRQRELGQDHARTIEAMSDLALVLVYLGRYQEVEALSRDVLARSKEVAIAEYVKLDNAFTLARVLWEQDKPEESEAVSRQALSMGGGPENEQRLLRLMRVLAQALLMQEKYEDAKEVNEQALEQLRKSFGPRDLETLATMDVQAYILAGQGRYNEAETLHRQVVEEREKELGSEHPIVFMSIDNLALTLLSQGKYKKAEELLRQAVGQFEMMLRPEHPSMRHALSHLAESLQGQHKEVEAREIGQRVLMLTETSLGPNNPRTLASVYDLACILTDQHRYDEAIPLWERACAGYQAFWGADHRRTSECCEQYDRAVAARDRRQPNARSADEGSSLTHGLAKMEIGSSKHRKT